jgi:ABC transporter C-terminal domain
MSPWRFFRRHLGIFASIDAHCAAFAAEMRRNSDGRSLGRMSESRARPVAGCGHGRVGQRQRADRPGRSRLGEAWRERALSELPKKIDALHAEIASLHQSLADPDFYRQDARAFAVKTARLGVARSELEAAETEWLELEILREEFKS